jgi:hypothetical protein
MRKLSVILLSVAMLLTFGAVWAQDNQSPVTQGDFAVLLASNMNAAAPNGGWKPQTAARFLADTGVTPISGAWNLTAKLTEGNLAHIMRLMGLSFYSTRPDQIVVWAKANAIIGQYRDKFMAFKIHSTASDDSQTSHISEANGSGSPATAMPPPPASPIIP